MIHEKRSGMKEMLTINGLSHKIYVSNIFFQNAIFTILISPAVALVLTQNKQFMPENLTFQLLFGVFIIINLANISFSMWFSTLFDNAMLG